MWKGEILGEFEVKIFNCILILFKELERFLFGDQVFYALDSAKGLNWSTKSK